MNFGRNNRNYPNQAFNIESVFSCSAIKSLIIEFVPSSFASSDEFKIIRSIFNNSDKGFTTNLTDSKSLEIFIPTGTLATILYSVNVDQVK